MPSSIADLISDAKATPEMLHLIGESLKERVAPLLPESSVSLL